MWLGRALISGRLFQHLLFAQPRFCSTAGREQGYSPVGSSCASCRHVSCCFASHCPGVLQVSPNTTSAVVRLLKPGEDEITQHYAVKTIENIASQNREGNEWGARFCTMDVVTALVQVGILTKAHGRVVSSHAPPADIQVFSSVRNDGLKSTTASTISRLLRFNPSLVNFTMDKFGVRLLMTGKALADSLGCLAVGSRSIGKTGQAILRSPWQGSEVGLKCMSVVFPRHIG